MSLEKLKPEKTKLFIKVTKKSSSGSEEAILDISDVEWIKISGIWRSSTGWTPADPQAAIAVESHMARVEELKAETREKLSHQLSPLEASRAQEAEETKEEEERPKAAFGSFSKSSQNLEDDGDFKTHRFSEEKEDENIEYVSEWYYSPKFRKAILLILLFGLPFGGGFWFFHKIKKETPPPNPLADNDIASLVARDYWVTNESPGKLDRAATLKLLYSSILEATKAKAATEKGYFGAAHFEEVQPYLQIYGQRLADLFCQWAKLDEKSVEAELKKFIEANSAINISDGTKNGVGMNLTGLGEYPSKADASSRWSELEELLQKKKEVPPKDYGFNIFGELGETLEDGTLDSYKMGLLESWARVRKGEAMPSPIAAKGPRKVGENWADLSSSDPMGSKNNPKGTNLPEMIAKKAKPSFIPPDWVAAEENNKIRKAVLAAIIQDTIFRAKATAVIERGFSGNAQFKDFSGYLYLDPKIVNFYCKSGIISRSSLEPHISNLKNLKSPNPLCDGAQNGIGLHLTSWGQYPDKEAAQGWLSALESDAPFRDVKTSVNNQRRAIERSLKSGLSDLSQDAYSTEQGNKSSMPWGAMENTTPAN